MDAIFTWEKLYKSNGVDSAINNFPINDAVYKLNKATASDAQGDLMSNIDTVTHTSNGILDHKLLIVRTIREFSVLPPQKNLTVRLMPQTLLTPAVK